MKIIYFAWLRNKIGLAEEVITPPSEITTVAGLLTWMQSRGPGFADALSDLDSIRVAVNQDYAKPGDPVGPDDEVALFPPVTGG